MPSSTKVVSLDLKTDRKSLMRTVCGSEFRTDGAENWKARLVCIRELFQEQDVR